MQSLAKKKPISVMVIGWMYIAVASLMILLAIPGFISFIISVQKSGGAIFSLSDEGYWLLKIARVAAIYLHTLHIFFAIFMLVASIQFLKLRTWTRTALEFISWWLLVYTISFGIFLGFHNYIWADMSFAITLFVKSLAIGVIVPIVCGIPILVIIKFLRGITIREALSKDKQRTSANTA